MAAPSVKMHNDKVARELLFQETDRLYMSEREAKMKNQPEELVIPETGSPAFIKASVDELDWTEFKKKVPAGDKIVEAIERVCDGMKDLPVEQQASILPSLNQLVIEVVKAVSRVMVGRSKKPDQQNVQINLDTGGIDVNGRNSTRLSSVRKASRGAPKMKAQENSTSPASPEGTASTSRPALEGGEKPMESGT